MLGISQQKYKAVAYYRHSAEDKQENSVAIQREHTEKFARENNIEIIHEESDEGKSGLLPNRPAFERLFSEWVENPEALQFDYILVYDVSRWGRFQDQDEAAHYTYRCRMQGKEVVYVSRGFMDNSNPLYASLETSLQRYMAAEYSRQLSEKVFYGCLKVAQQGYSAGGTAVYGMERELLDVNRKRIRSLKTGEHKQIANERVTFAPKEDETTETVREIFNLFVKERYLIQDIVKHLNKKNVLSANSKRWDKSKIIKILTDETYIGTRIYNKTWGRLKQKSHKNPRSEWVVVPNAFKAVVDKELFKEAQERLYWMFPSNWRKGTLAINRVRKDIRNKVFQWLFSKGVSEFEANEIFSKLPIIFAVKLESNLLTQWCYVITEKNRRYDKALGISVGLEQKGVTDDFFAFSVKDFTQTNFLILSKNSSLYHSCKTGSDKIEEIIIYLIKQFRRSELKYRHRYQFVEQW